MRAQLSAALVIAVLALTGCERLAQGGEGAIDAGPAPLTTAAIRAAPVPSLCQHPEGRLIDGSLPGLKPGMGGVVLDDVQLQDLDEDGVDEAIATLTCSTGGNVGHSTVHVYRSGPTHVGQADLDDDDDIGGSPARNVDQISVNAGVLFVRVLERGEDDANCCPSVEVSRHFVLSGNRVVPVEPPQRDGAGMMIDAACFDSPVTEALCRAMVSIRNGERSLLTDDESAEINGAKAPGGPWTVGECWLVGDVTVECAVRFEDAPPGADHAGFRLFPANAEYTGDELITPPGEPVRYEMGEYLGIGSATDFAED